MKSTTLVLGSHSNSEYHIETYKAIKENIVELFYLSMVCLYLEDCIVGLGFLYVKSTNRGRKEQKKC